MVIYLLPCKEMVTGKKKLLISMVPLHFAFYRLVLPMVPFRRKFNSEQSNL